MIILGIHDGHNSSACILVNGRVQFAIQEERLRRIKNFWGIPIMAIKNCLSYSGMSIDDVDLVAVASENQFVLPNKNISRDEYMASMHLALEGNFSLRQRISLLKAVFVQKLKLNKIFKVNQNKIKRIKFYKDIFGENFSNKICFVNHHISHYSTAAFGSGYWLKHEFLTFTLDGQGDDLCGSIHLIDKKGNVSKITTISANNSIANLYGIITVCLGFNVWEDEYKIMGMAPYSNPERAKFIGNKFLSFFEWENNNFKMKNNIKRLMDRNETLLKKRIDEIIKFERFDNICGGIQYAFEQIILKWINNYTSKFNVNYIALAGGAFMNVKLNLKISQLTMVKKMFVYPSCGDETISIGAAMKCYFDKTEKLPDPVKDIFYGNDYKKNLNVFINKIKKNKRLKISKPLKIEKKCAELLAKNEILARFSGRSEFGARALGNRSILANPSNSENIRIINDMIKKRDFWMPFACSIIEDEVQNYIDNTKKIKSPYMIMSFSCKKNFTKIQAGLHPRDHTIRPQIVNKLDNPKYYKLLKNFHEITNIGGILNTSFNLHGFPLVEKPEDAIEVFMKSGLKYLAIEEFLIEKISL